MREREMRRRTVRQHNLLHEGFDIELVVGKIANVSLAGIAQPARGVTLAAPIDHGHREPPIAQVTDGFEVFFNLLAPAGEHANRSLATGRRRPTCEAQFGAIRRLDHPAYDVLRNRIRRNGDERHERDRKNSGKFKTVAVKTGAASALLNTMWPLPYHHRAGR